MFYVQHRVDDVDPYRYLGFYPASAVCADVVWARVIGHRQGYGYGSTSVVLLSLCFLGLYFLGLVWATLCVCSTMTSLERLILLVQL